jgi:hypothetical protein
VSPAQGGVVFPFKQVFHREIQPRTPDEECSSTCDEIVIRFLATVSLVISLFYFRYKSEGYSDEVCRTLATMDWEKINYDLVGESSPSRYKLSINNS